MIFPWPFVTIGIFFVGMLMAVAFLTYVERKLIARLQRRHGPSVVGPWGLLQPLADAWKMIHKETIVPINASKFWFFCAPVLAFVCALAPWAVIPWQDTWWISSTSVDVLYLLVFGSLGTYSVMMAGWSSGSRYSLLGGVRATAQMISYELSLSLVYMTVVLTARSFRLIDIVHAQETCWFIVPHAPLAIIFLIASLAESNRTPFDIPESEAELVSGYNTEYSSMGFGLFMLSEYAHIITISAIGSLLFLGGWLPLCTCLSFVPGWMWMIMKMSLIIFMFIWTRSTLPRYRYDQLMRIGWKNLLPASFAWFIITSCLLKWKEGGL